MTESQNNSLVVKLLVGIISVLLIIILLLAGYRITKFTIGGVELEAPTSQPLTTPVYSQLPTSTAAPNGPVAKSLGTIIVFGNSNAGIQVEISQSGIYRFAYRNGAYATYTVGNEPVDTKTWLTAVFIYKGNSASWNGRIINDTDLFLRLADMKYFSTSDEAEKAAQGQYVEAQLNQGDVITLIAVDAFDSYADNPGNVFIEWFLVTY